MTAELECANCPALIDPAVDTHYHVGEEERPVMQFEKKKSVSSSDRSFSRAWFLCAECAAGVIPDLEDNT